MNKSLHIFFILNFCCLSVYGQIDTAKYKSNCLVCDIYKKEYKKGKVIKNILKAFADTSIVTIFFECNDCKGSPVPNTMIIFENTKTTEQRAYYTNINGKIKIKIKEGNYKVVVKGFFETDAITINSLSLEAGDIREIIIDVGESKCQQARRFHYNLSYPHNNGFNVEYVSDFKNCTDYYLDEGDTSFGHRVYLGNRVYEIDFSNPKPDSAFEYHKNLQKSYIIYYHNCEKNGTWKFWFPDGRIAKIENYNYAGKIDGIWKTWNQNGDIIAFESYKNGIPIGNFCYIAQDHT